MSLCFETIKVVDGKPLHVKYHNNRCNKTRQEIFTCKDMLDLNDAIHAPDNETYRCRVTYGKEIEKVEFFPLKPRVFRVFTCKEIDFDYSHKWCDRKAIDHAKENSDAVIFTREGKLLDTPIANIALCIDGVWVTPKYPLLFGTARARYLEEGWLKEQELTTEHLRKAEKFAIMNALIQWIEIKNFRIEE